MRRLHTALLAAGCYVLPAAAQASPAAVIEYTIEEPAHTVSLLYKPTAVTSKQTRLLTVDGDVSSSELFNSPTFHQLIHISPHSQCTIDTHQPHSTIHNLLQGSLQSVHRALQTSNTYKVASDITVLADDVLARLQHASSIPFTCMDALTRQSHNFELKSALTHRAITHTLKQQIIDAGHRYESSDKRPYPHTGIDIIGKTLSSDWEWVKEWVRWHYGDLHPFQTYNVSAGETGVFDLHTAKELAVGEAYDSTAMSADEVTIAIAADFGAGTLESDLVTFGINGGKDPVTGANANTPDWTIHVGDLYYLGTSDEAESNMLGNVTRFNGEVEKGVTWPLGKLGSFALAGNHEAFSRFYGYYDTLLPALGVRSSGKGQQTSYNALVNVYWRVINLDTGYHSYAKTIENRDNTQPQAVVDWLRDVVRLGDVNDKRGIILLSHHQPISSFLEPYTATIEQLLQEQVLPANRSIVWLFGHEHRMSIYNQHRFNATHDDDTNAVYPDDPYMLRDNTPSDDAYVNVYPRCIGNGGFPPLVVQVPIAAHSAGLLAFDDRTYQNAEGTFGTLQIGFNGWVRLSLKANRARIEYVTLTYNGTHLTHENATVLAEETFVVADDGNVELQSLSIRASMTVIDHYSSSATNSKTHVAEFAIQ